MILLQKELEESNHRDEVAVLKKELLSKQNEVKELKLHVEVLQEKELRQKMEDRLRSLPQSSSRTSSRSKYSNEIAKEEREEAQHPTRPKRKASRGVSLEWKDPSEVPRPSLNNPKKQEILREDRDMLDPDLSLEIEAFEEEMNRDLLGEEPVSRKTPVSVLVKEVARRQDSSPLRLPSSVPQTSPPVKMNRLQQIYEKVTRRTLPT